MSKKHQQQINISNSNSINSTTVLLSNFRTFQIYYEMCIHFRMARIAFRYSSTIKEINKLMFDLHLIHFKWTIPHRLGLCCQLFIRLFQHLNSNLCLICAVCIKNTFSYVVTNAEWQPVDCRHREGTALFPHHMIKLCWEMFPATTVPTAKCVLLQTLKKCELINRIYLDTIGLERLFGWHST